ncbi:MAG: hypothetical protein JWP37_745 [Mucilaginibacter sp.]|nr:hypothetical protein [Mucilaginibacter sp.]
MAHRKKLERRTYSQDRYYILIKRQRSGKATFNELTELDEIVNRVPDIRERVIRESFNIEDLHGFNEPQNMPGKDDNQHGFRLQHDSLWNRLKSFINRVFYLQISVTKVDIPTLIF